MLTALEFAQGGQLKMNAGRPGVRTGGPASSGILKMKDIAPLCRRATYYGLLLAALEFAQGGQLAIKCRSLIQEVDYKRLCRSLMQEADVR